MDIDAVNSQHADDRPRPKKRSLLLRLCIAGLIAAGVALVGCIALIACFIMPYFADLDLSKRPACHPFKSPAAKERYLRYYDRRSLEWPVPSETTSVRTSFGTTFVRICGPDTAPRMLTDSQLQRIAPPALFLVGEHETIYHAHEAVERLRRVAPRIEAAVIPGAGHDLLVVATDDVDKKIIAFLGD